jgi:hypothetical protein
MAGGRSSPRSLRRGKEVAFADLRCPVAVDLRDRDLRQGVVLEKRKQHVGKPPPNRVHGRRLQLGLDRRKPLAREFVERRLSGVVSRSNARLRRDVNAQPDLGQAVLQRLLRRVWSQPSPSVPSVSNWRWLLARKRSAYRVSLEASLRVTTCPVAGRAIRCPNPRRSAHHSRGRSLAPGAGPRLDRSRLAPTALEPRWPHSARRLSQALDRALAP